MSAEDIFIAIVYVITETEFELISTMSSNNLILIKEAALIQAKDVAKEVSPILVEIRLRDEYYGSGDYSFGLGYRSDENWQEFEMD